MKNILLLFLVCLPVSLFAQFYYSDIIDSRLLGERMKAYVTQKVKSVTATGYDARGVKSTDFNEYQEVQPDQRVLKISSRNGFQLNRQYYHFDEQYRLIRIIDSSGAIKSSTVYTYDAGGHLNSIRINTTDSLQDFTEAIQHTYQNSSPGKPQKLWRVINGHDSTEYRFTADEKGNVIDEQLYRRGRPIDSVFYYYDDENRLTDIVRYNKKARKLLPSLMFEYDDAGRLIQKMTILSTNNPDYLIWRYVYNDKGLKTKEALFNKQKELTGRIDYAYTFAN
jgi:hypothetical protein